jgi:hypothetical protein
VADTDAATGLLDAAPSSTKYRARTGELANAAGELDALLRILVANCHAVAGDLDSGLSALDSVRSVAGEAGRTFRRDVHAATMRFEKAMQALRGESFRVLVRDGGISVTELSRQSGLSAQMIRRLLRIGEGA